MNVETLVRRGVQCFRLAVASLVPGLLNGCASHSVSAPQSFKPRTPHELRVMTFNLRVRTRLDGRNIWDRRRDTVVQRVRAFDADLLGTQEGLAPMEDFLREKLDDYTFFGAGRNDGQRRGEMCGMFFKTARFDRLDGGHFWLSRTPEKVGSRAWGEVYPRLVTWLKLKPRDGGATFYWFNTHFDAWIGWARTQSARLLREEMARIAGASPSIVTGDFNSPADSMPYRILLAETPPPAAPLTDAFRAAHPVVGRDEGTFHFFTGWTGGRRIDWILVSGHFQIIDAEIDHSRGATGYPSDHFPVVAILRARRENESHVARASAGIP
jgi:endonuclease/exonuclease/phosphatase family metal-dependent hydrolase